MSAAISGPLWGLLIDNFRSKRFIYFVMCVGAASSVFPLPWIAKEIRSHELTSCYLNGTVVNTTTTTTANETLKTKFCYPDLVPFESTLFYLMLGTLLKLLEFTYIYQLNLIFQFSIFQHFKLNRFSFSIVSSTFLN